MLVLEKVRGAATSSMWRRSVQSERKGGPVQVPKGSRLVWVARADGAVTFTDLPEASGSLAFGDYSIIW